LHILYVMHDCKRELRGVELKVTSARLKVLDVLEHSDIPLDAASITRHIKGDKVTVFRILHSLADRGLVKPIQFNEGKFRYEYAGKPEHHHFVCEHCGTVEDIEDCNVSALVKTITKKKRVLVKRHSLEFFGLCADCQT
jgi:Fe2+ or Zn2+ uptake regulation protein